MLNRISHLIRIPCKGSHNLFRKISTTISRNGEANWTYRDPLVKPNRTAIIQAEIFGGIMWYWILYHLFTQYDHIIGEFPYPDPSAWTNEELGILPDDED